MKKLSILLVLLLLLPGCSLFAAVPQPDAIVPRASAAEGLATPIDRARQEALDYFAQIAFGSEYGAADKRVRKWSMPIRAAVHGNPTGEDLDMLRQVMDGLNAVEGFPGISLVDQGQNMDISFVPLDGMDQAVPGYVEGNWGFFTVRFGRDGIRVANVAIATDVTSQEARNHLLYEEVLQSTGLMRDSELYEDSIFYGCWTTVQQPMELDWELLRMLYLPELKPGMGMDDAMDTLNRIYRPSPGQTGKAAARKTA